MAKHETIINREKDIADAEEVRKFQALYDKICADYHRRDVKKIDDLLLWLNWDWGGKYILYNVDDW